MPTSSSSTQATTATTATIAHSAEVEQAPLPCPPGFVVWRVVGETASAMLPALLLNPPARVWRGYRARVIATLTGRCPLCGEVASLSADPETHRAAWAVTPVTVGIDHLPGCEAVFQEPDRKWFDPRALRPSVPVSTPASPASNH